MDVISFSGFSEGVTVNLNTGRALTSYGTSTLVNVEDIEGSIYNDTLTGNSKNNQIQGFAGNDTINEGTGFDTAVYFDANSAVNIDLSTGVVTEGSGNDTLISIERVLGSRFNDVLISSNKNETFVGGFGVDILNGAGGEGIDRFNYKTLTDSLLNNFDVIKDFDANILPLLPSTMLPPVLMPTPFNAYIYK